MKNIEIEKVIKKYFQTFINEDNFVYNKNILYRCPLEDILLGFCFEKSEFNIDSVYVSVFAQPLYLKSENIILSFGKRLRGVNGELWCLKNNPNLDGVIGELKALMKDVIDGFLNKVNQPSKLYDYYQDKLVNIRMVEAATYSAIYSNRHDRELILDNFISILKKENLEINWVRELLHEAENIKLIIDDDEAIENYFQNNINFTMKAIGVE